jgi:hypothetical protein
MRDPARIDEIIDLLRDAWHQHPDLRLGQFVVSLLEYDRPAHAAFYVEDDLAQKFLRAMVDRGTNGMLAAHRDEAKRAR